MNDNKKASLILLIVGLIWTFSAIQGQADGMQRDGKDRTGTFMLIILGSGAWTAGCLDQLRDK